MKHEIRNLEYRRLTGEFGHACGEVYTDALLRTSALVMAYVVEDGWQEKWTVNWDHEFGDRLVSEVVGAVARLDATSAGRTTGTAGARRVPFDCFPFPRVHYNAIIHGVGDPALHP